MDIFSSNFFLTDTHFTHYIYQGGGVLAFLFLCPFFFDGGGGRQKIQKMDVIEVLLDINAYFTCL